MKISVVTVCFNSEATIANTVRSFLSQSHPDKEMIVVDGLSRDRTVEIVKAFGSPQISIVSEKDRGTYDAMNKGLDRYTGDAVGFLNSDDTFHDDQALARIAAALENADAVTGDVLMVADHVSKRPVRTWRGSPYRRGIFYWGWAPPHPTFYARRGLVDAVGRFRTDFVVSADYDFMLRALELQPSRAEYIPHILVDFLIGGISTAGWRGLWRNNVECLTSRQQYLGAGFVDPAFVLKPASKLFQFHWREKT